MMNNNYNPNGQFGGWGQNQYGGYNTPYYNYYNEQYLKQQEKQNDKKMLKKMGSWFGFGIILYIAIAYGASFVVALLSQFIPSVGKIYENNMLSSAYDIMGSIIFIGVPFVIAHSVLKKNKITGILPFGTSYNGKAAVSLTMAFIPVMMFSSMGINYISAIFQEMMGITFYSGMEGFTIKGVGETVIAVFSIAVIPAIIEETVIRGIIMQPLRRFGDKFAIVASALIFSLMHGNMVQIPYTVVAGIIFGYLVIATGSIWPSIILHFINNLYSVIILSVNDNFGELAGNLAVVVVLALFVIVGIIGGAIFFTMNYRNPLKKGVDTLKTGEKYSALFVNAPMIFAFIILFLQTFLSIEF